MAFFRRSLSNPGFAGGTLEEQLARALQSGDVNAGQGQALAAPVSTATRPRTTMPSDTAIASAKSRMRDMLTKQAAQSLTANRDVPDNAPAMRQAQPEMNPLPTRPFSMNGQNVAGEDAPFNSGGEFAPDRPRRTQMRDYVADDAQYLRDLESQPRNWKDKTVDAIRALNTNFNGAGQISPPTKRERDILRAQGGLARDIAVDKQRDASNLNGLVPIEQDGQIIGYAPRRTAAGTQIRATDTSARLANTKRRTDGYIDHLKTLKGEAQKKLAAQLFKTGALNTPEGMKYAAETFGIPQGLQEAFIRGEHRDAVDDEGNYIDINRRTNKVTDTGEKSYDVVKEKGRNDRAIARNAQSEKNATIVSGGQVARMGDPEVPKKNIAEIENDIAEIDQQIKDLTAKREAGGLTPSEGAALNALPREKATLERERRDEREKLGKIESAQSGQRTTAPTTKRKWSPTPAFRAAFQKKMGRAPTQADIDAYAAAANQ